MLPYHKILVTGASGFVGGRIAETLAAIGVEVIAIGRNWHGSLVKQGMPGVECKTIDLVQNPDIEALVNGCDAVVHAAAFSAPWGSYDAFHQANVVATQRMLDAATQAKVKRFVFIATPSIYFDYTNRFDVGEAEPLPAKMVNHYAATKLLAEKLVLDAPLPAIALRPRAIIGRGDRVIMPRLLNAYEQGKLKVIGDGKNMAHLTAVANVVEAVRCALLVPEYGWGKAYNITDEAPVELWAVINEMLELLGKQKVTKKIPYGVANIAAALMEMLAFINGKEPALTRYGVGTLAKSLTMSTRLAKEILGYQPVQTTQEAMREFVDWWKESSINESGKK